MTIEYNAPPLPHFISCGEDTYSVGQSHVSRKNIGVFDLLIVTRGMLHIGEDEESWQLSPGQALVLSPDRSHYQIEPCKEETHFYWLHFHIFNLCYSTEQVDWNAIYSGENAYIQIVPYKAHLPRFVRLRQPERTYDKMNQLLQFPLRGNFFIQWQQQIVFQQVLQDLLESGQNYSARSFDVANKAVEYIRNRYREPVTAEQLQKELNFHPIYISRCMKMVYNLTPLEYLLKYRIDRAKQLLIDSDLPISIIAEQVGFNSSAYFTRCFTREETITPMMFRKRFLL